MNIAPNQKIYSVWNYQTLRYDYYSGLGRSIFDAVHDSVVSRFSRDGHTVIGYVPEKAARVLPAGATYSGSGAVAVGEVVDQNNKMGHWVSVGLVAVGVFAAYKLYKAVA